MAKKDLIREIANEAPNRRRFMQKITTAGAAVTAAMTVGTRGLSAAAPSDADILNFALNLEYLEAEFYTVATTGQTIEQLGVPVTGTGTQGATTGGMKVNFSNSLVFTGDVSNEIAFDERAHVVFIRTALQSMGVTPIAKPAINLNALGVGFNSQMDFLQLARAFEDVGVTAYAGAAPLIQDKNILGAAARILAAEAEHVGNVRLQVTRLRVATAALDGVDILPPPSGSKFFSLDNNALAQVRTPGQVLYIVYGFKANASSGGFFPNGVNGPINMSSGSA